MPQVKRGYIASTVPEALVSVCTSEPARLFVVEFGEERLTGEELFLRVRAGAGCLQHLDITRGSYVAIDVGTLTWTECAVTFFAAAWVGATSVMFGDHVGPPAPIGISSAVTVSAKPTHAWSGHYVRPEDLRNAEPTEDPPQARPDDSLDIVYTSGTTGAPKAVHSTHEQWVKPILGGVGRLGGVVAHFGPPASTSAGLHGVMLTHLMRGVTSVTGARIAEFLAAATEMNARDLHFTPHAGKVLVNRCAQIDEAWRSEVRTITTIGGPLPSSVGLGLKQVFPKARIVALYGLTEAGSAVLAKVFDPGKPHSIGRPVGGTEVRVAGDDGLPAAAGVVGELLLRNQATGRLLYHDTSLDDGDEGWVPTGDLAVRDGGGELRLVGRVKEMMFVESGRVSPMEIEEDLLALLPQSVDCAVVGIPQPDSWDKVVVFLSGSDSDDLAAAVEQLRCGGSTLTPDAIELVGEIPRGPTGKPLRLKLTQYVISSEQVATDT